METIINNEFMSLWYLPTSKIVHHQFHQYMFGEPFRQGLLKGAELLKLHGAQKWLSDDRENSAVHPDDSAWGQAVWFPLAKKAGWKYWAVVLPHKAVGKMNMKDFIATYSAQGITAQAFSEPAEAMIWLRRQ